MTDIPAQSAAQELGVRDLPYLAPDEAAKDRPVNTAALTRAVAAPVLMGVRSIVTGHPASNLSPQRLAAILRGAEYGDPISYLELAEQMEELDPHYRSVLGTRKFAVTQLKMTVEAVSDSPADQEQAKLITDWLKRDTLEEELFDILDAIGKGYSLVEIVWETSAKQWLPKELCWRDQRWFIMDRINGVTPLLRDQAGFLPLDPYKFIYHRSKSKSGLPVRGGLARPVAWSWMFKNYSLKDWVSFCEVFGMPLRLGKYEVGETEDNIRLLMSAVANMGSDAAAVIAKNMEIEFVQAKGGGAGASIPYESLCAFLDQQTSKAVLGQTATTDAINGGHAVGKTHNEVRGDLKRADARQLQATLNRDLVRAIIDLNFGKPADGRYPQVIIEEEDDPLEVGAMASAVAQLVPMGLTVKKAEVMQRLGFTEPGPDDEILSAPSAAAAPEIDPKTGKPVEGAPGDPTPTKPEEPSEGQLAQGAEEDDAASALIALAAASVARKRPKPFSAFLRLLTGPFEARATASAAAAAEADAIDGALDDVLDDWRPLIEPVVRPIERLVASTSSLEELRDRLAALPPDMKVEDLAELLAQAGFTARIAGVSGASLHKGKS